MPRLVAPFLEPGSLNRRPQPTLRGRGLVLRPWRLGDADDLVAAYADGWHDVHVHTRFGEDGAG